jgi:mono/diheme cytochrome c family protein
MKTSRLTIAVSSLLFALTAVSAQTPPAATLTENPVFQKDCAKCHGKTAEGHHFAGPSLLSEKTTSSSADELRDIITNGKHHMPKFAGKLTPEEINTLVDQIKTAKK